MRFKNYEFDSRLGRRIFVPDLVICVGGYSMTSPTEEKSY